MARRYDDDPALVVAAQAGDEAAFTMLFRRWFDPCFDVARRIVHNDDTAAEVAQETFLVAWRQIGTLRDPSAFGGWVLRTSRNKALNRLDRERRSVAVDQDEHPVLADLEAVGDVAGEVTAREQQDLVWAAAAALGERDASVLDLHLRHGFDAAEIAEALDVTTNNAHQLLFRMKGKLAAGIRAWVLFKGGDPQCEELGRVLQAAGATSFSATTVKVISKHVDGCDECTRRQAVVLAPEAMFAAVPLLPAGAVLRDRVASGLRTDGVPLGPDAARPISSSGSGSEGPTAPTEGPTSPVGGSADATTVGPVAAVAPPGPVDEVVDVVDVSPPASESHRSKVLAVVGASVVLLLLLGGLAIVRSGADQADVAVAPADTTTPVPEPRVGTSVPTTVAAVAEPSTTAGGPVPVPPSSVRPPSSGPSTTVAPPLPPTTSPPSPPPGPPVISGFRVTRASAPGGACPLAQWAFTLVWATTGATEVSIVRNPGGTPIAGPPSGNRVSCAVSPSATWTLTATGPGGQVSANG